MFFYNAMNGAGGFNLGRKFVRGWNLRQRIGTGFWNEAIRGDVEVILPRMWGCVMDGSGMDVSKGKEW